MITKKQYVEFLLSTPKNCTCTYLAEHLEDVSHDVVNDMLWQKHFMPREVWRLVQDRLEDSKDAFLIVDDSVHDKRYSRFIELVRAQYSGNEHRVVKGIGVVSLVHSGGKEEDFYPIDYRVYAPDVDGKTKNDHLQEMFVNAVEHKQLQARTILFDGWYASAENLKLIHRRQWTFFTTLKSNRLVSLSKEQGYIHLEEIEWTPDRMAQGVIVKLKEVPFKVRLFKLVAPDGDIDWVITNDLDETVTARVAEDSSDVRWQVERGFKITKRGGWQWQRTHMTDPQRAARLWLAVAVATLWLLKVGGAAEETIPPSTFLDLTAALGRARRQRRATRLRLVSVFRQGWNLILVALLQGRRLPTDRFVPEPWPRADNRNIKLPVIHEMPLAA